MASLFICVSAVMLIPAFLVLDMFFTLHVSFFSAKHMEKFSFAYMYDGMLYKLSPSRMPLVILPSYTLTAV